MRAREGNSENAKRIFSHWSEEQRKFVEAVALFGGSNVRVISEFVQQNADASAHP